MAPAIGTPEVTRARRSSSEPAPPEAMSLAWGAARVRSTTFGLWTSGVPIRSEEHTSELQSHRDVVCRLLLEKRKQGYDRSQPNEGDEVLVVGGELEGAEGLGEVDDQPADDGAGHAAHAGEDDDDEGPLDHKL